MESEGWFTCFNDVDTVGKTVCGPNTRLTILGRLSYEDQLKEYYSLQIECGDRACVKLFQVTETQGWLFPKGGIDWLNFRDKILSIIKLAVEFIF